MARMPKTLKNFTAYIDGRPMAGVVEEVVPPKLAVATEEHRGGGMDAPVEIDMGTEKLEAELTFSEAVTEVFQLWGLIPGQEKLIVLRGAREGDDGAVESIVIELRGRFRELDAGNWQAGQKNQFKATCAAVYYKLTVADEDLIEIDILGGVRKVGGADQLEGVRKALGE